MTAGVQGVIEAEKQADRNVLKARELLVVLILPSGPDTLLNVGRSSDADTSGDE
jgi:hypothetical protein